MINLKNNDHQYFKWTVIVAKDPQRILKLQHCENKYNWNRLEVPLAIQKIGKFEKNSPCIPVNVLFKSKNGIHTACRSEKGKCSKKANLLIIADGENTHYTAIKNISRLFIKAERKKQLCVSLLHELFEWFLESVSKR